MRVGKERKGEAENKKTRWRRKGSGNKGREKERKVGGRLIQ